ARRHARGRRRACGVPALGCGALHHRPELRRRRRHDAQDDLRRMSTLLGRAAGEPMPTARAVVFGAGFLRATANGLIGVVAGIYLAKLGFAPAAFGVILAAGIAGTAVAAAVVTFWGDRIGRKRGLILLALASAAGGAGEPAAPRAVVWLGGARRGRNGGLIVPAPASGAGGAATAAASDLAVLAAAA